jgi:hypothetical protein
MRQYQRATDQLVGLFGINPQSHMDLNGLIKLPWLEALENFYSLSQRNRVSRNLGYHFTVRF